MADTFFDRLQMLRVGLASAQPSPRSAPFHLAFAKRMAELGYQEGKPPEASFKYGGPQVGVSSPTSGRSTRRSIELDTAIPRSGAG
jgi:hypothetical protein